MRVLVTGGAGFVGSHVVRHLVTRGDDVSIVLRPTTPTHRLDDVLGSVRVVRGDLADAPLRAEALATARPDVLVHLAWYAAPTDYLDSRRNLDALAITTHLFDDAFREGCAKVVGVGTCLEYARADRLRREGDVEDPESIYAATKHAAHAVGRALAHRQGAELAWARLFHMHGPSEDPLRLIPQVAAALRAGAPFDLSGGEQVRDHLHVADVAAAVASLSATGVVGPINVCSGQPVTLRRVLEEVGNLLGRRDLLRFGVRPYREGEVMHLAGDASALRRLGWQPRFDLRNGLADALGDTQTNHDGWGERQ